MSQNYVSFLVVFADRINVWNFYRLRYRIPPFWGWENKTWRKLLLQKPWHDMTRCSTNDGKISEYKKYLVRMSCSWHALFFFVTKPWVEKNRVSVHRTSSDGIVVDVTRGGGRSCARTDVTCFWTRRMASVHLLCDLNWGGRRRRRPANIWSFYVENPPSRENLWRPDQLRETTDWGCIIYLLQHGLRDTLGYGTQREAGCVGRGRPSHIYSTKYWRNREMVRDESRAPAQVQRVLEIFTLLVLLWYSSRIEGMILL